MPATMPSPAPPASLFPHRTTSFLLADLPERNKEGNREERDLIFLQNTRLDAPVVAALMSRRLLQLMQMLMLMKLVAAQARPHAEAGRAAVHVGNLIREDPMAPPLFRLPSTQVGRSPPLRPARLFFARRCYILSACCFVFVIMGRREGGERCCS